MKETNLRKKFRLAIPHAGQDPDYSLHSCSPHYDELLLGTLPTASLLTRGGGRGDLEESKLQREGGDESYEEPRYITRQRCLALNEWALDLFDHKRYGQVRNAVDKDAFLSWYLFREFRSFSKCLSCCRTPA